MVVVVCLWSPVEYLHALLPSQPPSLPPSLPLPPSAPRWTVASSMAATSGPAWPTPSLKNTLPTRTSKYDSYPSLPPSLLPALPFGLSTFHPLTRTQTPSLPPSLLQAEVPFSCNMVTLSVPGAVLSSLVQFSRRFSLLNPPVEKGGFLQVQRERVREGGNGSL